MLIAVEIAAPLMPYLGTRAKFKIKFRDENIIALISIKRVFPAIERRL